MQLTKPARQEAAAVRSQLIRGVIRTHGTGLE